MQHANYVFCDKANSRNITQGYYTSKFNNFSIHIFFRSFYTSEVIPIHLTNINGMNDLVFAGNNFSSPKTVKSSWKCPIKMNAFVLYIDQNKPILTPPSASASIITKTYAGPLPLSAVTASIMSSTISSLVPIDCRSDCAMSASFCVAFVPRTKTEHPWLTIAGVFGITRITLDVWGRVCLH